MTAETKKTVVVALCANALIAVAKFTTGLVTGSSALLAEAAHSVADTFNQVFLLISLAAANRPADAEHPFGYARARFFWALIAAAGIFVAGGVFSLYEGVHALLTGGEPAKLLISYVVLGIALAAEGTSWIRAVLQLRGQAASAGVGLLRFVRRSKDPTVKTVLLEDTAALIGILFAAVGIGLHYVTGQAWWDAAAAIAVGLLLITVAITLGRENQSLLLGESADPELFLALYRDIGGRPEVARVVELLTSHLGPESILVVVRVDLADQLRGDELERFSDRLKREVAKQWPQIQQLFLDPPEATTTRPNAPSSGSRVSPPTCGNQHGECAGEDRALRAAQRNLPFPASIRRRTPRCVDSATSRLAIIATLQGWSSPSKVHATPRQVFKPGTC